MTDEEIERAIWEGDVDFLQKHLHCQCCCSEHTFDHCPAKRWGGCRGQGSEKWPEEQESWARHYAAHHGMTREQFFGG